VSICFDTVADFVFAGNDEEVVLGSLNDGLMWTSLISNYEVRFKVTFFHQIRIIGLKAKSALPEKRLVILSLKWTKFNLCAKIHSPIEGKSWKNLSHFL